MFRLAFFHLVPRFHLHQSIILCLLFSRTNSIPFSPLCLNVITVEKKIHSIFLPQNFSLIRFSFTVDALNHCVGFLCVCFFPRCFVVVMVVKVLFRLTVSLAIHNYSKSWYLYSSKLLHTLSFSFVCCINLLLNYLRKNETFIWTPTEKKKTNQRQTKYEDFVMCLFSCVQQFVFSFTLNWLQTELMMIISQDKKTHWAIELKCAFHIAWEKNAHTQSRRNFIMRNSFQTFRWVNKMVHLTYFPDISLKDSEEKKRCLRFNAINE